ncbi:unnamed protein product [Candidula unifasciata]|uniref:Fibrinogen C-terminal domain-containing protein n=1 Tax=Candidula unifasciata TaxID=100452 RepID=A0A8S3ZJ50_9EUPU|nr:unnamed protein product [Candidula unifasciata]
MKNFAVFVGTMTLQAVCLSVCLILVVVQCQVLDFTRELTPDDIYCGNLRCVAKSSLNNINIAIYDTTDEDNSVKLASISVFAPEVSVDPSKNNVIDATGNISKYDGVLNVWFLKDFDCLYGAFQCELDFFDINGQSGVIRENLTPATEENATIVYSLAQIATQLKKHSEETDKQLEALKQDNEVLKTVLDSILVKVSRIDGLLNSTLEKEQQLGTSCYRGMPHKSSRETFLLQEKLLALCDTETDGGGWTIIQRRVRGDVDFYRGWGDYKRGFGTPDTDFWIGNDIIHSLTSQGYNQLRIDLVYNETKFFAQYTNFIQADESSAYTITISGYSGNTYDSMSYHKGSKFSTFDRDNDQHPESCAKKYHGAWWYNGCYASNLNGAWADANDTGMGWYFNQTNHRNNVSFTEMKIRYISR